MIITLIPIYVWNGCPVAMDTSLVEQFCWCHDPTVLVCYQYTKYHQILWGSISKLVWCLARITLNHCAVIRSNCRTFCWLCSSGNELKKFSRVQWRKYVTIVNIWVPFWVLINAVAHRKEDSVVQNIVLYYWNSVSATIGGLAVW